MQTFLPYPSFVESARVLDKRRVWKQTVEARQILNTLAGLSKGWVNHPAVKMWSGHGGLLYVYFQTMLAESINRGIKVTAYEVDPEVVASDQFEFIGPSWLGNDAFHAAHRSNLLRKDSKHYGQFGWTEKSDLPYIWPV